MKSAILLSGRRLEPHHFHFLTILRECTDVVGGISFPKRPGKLKRQIKKFGFRRPWQLIALTIGHLRLHRLAASR